MVITGSEDYVRICICLMGLNVYVWSGSVLIRSSVRRLAGNIRSAVLVVLLQIGYSAIVSDGAGGSTN